MSDESENTVDTKADKTASLISQVKADLKKSETESVKSKLKEIYKKRAELEKAIRLLDLESSKLVEDFNNGVL